MPRAAAVRLLALAIVFPVLMVLAAPVIAIVIHREGVPNYATHYRLLAQAVDRIWRETTDTPLRFVGSYTNIVNGVSFYLPSRPSTLDIDEPAVDAVGRRGERRARRHRAGLPGARGDLHGDPQRARGAACRATPSRCRAAISASPTRRCAT